MWTRNYDNLHSFLSEALTDFDVINITETSQNVNENFKTNVSIEGYELYSTPNNNRGGTSIYVKSIFNIVERSDLNILHNDFASI